MEISITKVKSITYIHKGLLIHIFANLDLV